MKKSLLIDGYNLIFASAVLREKMEQKPESARRALMELCRIYAGRKKDIEKFWIVFDGKEDFLSLPPGETAGVCEIYTRAGETADKRMARIVRESEEVTKWTVVSNDRAVLDRCYSYGAERVKASAFIRDLEGKSSPANPTGGSAALSAEKPLHPLVAQDITAEYKRKLGL
ncbi:MAG: NYN domain-containing protein [Candidatus Omnitrophica bacterium]|nr:NYN domain-containing protein [Candidatus Omnitrophota bacterium]